MQMFSEESTRAGGATILTVAMLLVSGCSGLGATYELSTFNASANQWTIANYHAQEATRLQQKADDLTARMLIYERLFGPDSEWVSGTHLLAQSYVDAAQEQVRLAEKHLSLAEGRRPSTSTSP
ncbi:MAG: hypothetical protein ABI945_04460 [Nitrospirales bacterium]